MQDMQAYFPNCPEAVVHALLELYKQVLAHINVNSQVRHSGDVHLRRGARLRVRPVTDEDNDEQVLQGRLYRSWCILCQTKHTIC